MKKNVVLLILFFSCFQHVYNQEEFRPSGSAYARIFFNYHTDLSGDGSAFEIQRAYLGYKYNISENFSGNITFDVGSPEISINDSVKNQTSYEMTAFLKIAAVTYSKGRFKAEAGMIGLKQFSLQEEYWGHRYIYKTHQDWTGMGTSADLGVSASYRFFEAFSADITVRNGQGYKKLQSDKALNTALGLTFTPVKGLAFRGFYDYIDRSGPQYTIAHFVGYKNEVISAGAEYNVQLNTGSVKDRDLHGFAVYAGYHINPKIELFGRVDHLASNIPEGETTNWNSEKDGYLIIGGIEYSPVWNIQVALDYQGYVYNNTGANDKNLIYMNFQYSF